MAMMGWLSILAVGTAAIVWGAELFAEHLAAASARLGLSAFALALLLAGAEPEELATVITASARGVDGVAFGDVIGANAAIVTVALGVGALVTTVPFGPRIRRYGFGGLAAAGRRTGAVDEKRSPRSTIGGGPHRRLSGVHRHCARHLSEHRRATEGGAVSGTTTDPGDVRHCLGDDTAITMGVAALHARTRTRSRNS